MIIDVRKSAIINLMIQYVLADKTKITSDYHYSNFEYALRKTDFYALVDKLVNYITLSGDEPEAGKMEDDLLEGGSDGLIAVLIYLLRCGQGEQKNQWWYNAKRLVRLIKRFSKKITKIFLISVLIFRAIFGNIKRK